MTKFAIAIKKFQATVAINYSVLIGQSVHGEYVATLFDDEFQVRERFLNPSQEDLFEQLKTYIVSNIGEITHVSEIKNDPLLIAMLSKLKE